MKNGAVVAVTLNPAIDQSVTVPGFRANAVNRAIDQRRTAGGKGLNVASFLADFGIPCAVTGFLGCRNAELFEAHFAARNLEDRFVRVEGETRSNLKLLNPVEEQVTDINLPGLAAGSSDLAALESILESLAGDHPWFVLSGSLPPGLPSTTYRDLTQRLRASGCPVLLDTSGEGLRHAFEASPNVIKPNQRELEEALDRKLPGESELCAVGSQLVNAGMDCVIVSRGAEGALFVNAQTTLAARHPGPAAIQSTVGAGDALVAGYLAARIREFDTEGTARLSVAFSVAALARVPGAPLSSSAIEAFAKEVSIAWR